jgi:hypothetical protein
MAYKADEATLQRLSNTNNPKDFLPLTTTSETGKGASLEIPDVSMNSF